MNVFSQAPGIQWQNTIGGNTTDLLWSIKQATDGGYILSGSSPSSISGDKTENSNGESDCWIIKLDSIGNIIWQNTIGGSGKENVLFGMQQTYDGGYILGFYSQSNISGDKSENNLDTVCMPDCTYDYWLVKTDASGNIQWQNTIGGDNDDELYSLQQTVDGGFILGGSSKSDLSGDKTENNWDTTNLTNDYWMIKTDSLGNIQWQNTIGGNGFDWLYTIKQTTDGGYILGGRSGSLVSGDKTVASNGNDDHWIVKTDASGNIQWQKAIGGGENEDIRSIQLTADGGYILGGSSRSNISGDKTENNWDPSLVSHDYWVVKIDFAGNVQWDKTIGGNDFDVLYSIHNTADGGFILGGVSYSSISGDKTEVNWDTLFNTSDYWIVKIDSVGNILWQKSFGGTDTDVLTCMQRTADDGYILGGYSESNISGDKSEGSHGYSDYWIIKLLPDTITTSAKNPDKLFANAIQISPNPATSELRIKNSKFRIEKIEIVDTYGKCLYNSVFQIQESALNIDVSFLSAGIYFVRILTAGGISAAKFVKE